MKTQILKSILPFVLTTVSSVSYAKDRTLNCRIGHEQGNAKIQILKVENHPKLTVFKIKLEMDVLESINTNDSQAQLEGLLVGQNHPGGIIVVSGLVNNQPNATTIINPSTLTIQGELKKSGASSLSLYDSARVLEHGFGAAMECR